MIAFVIITFFSSHDIDIFNLHG